MFLGRAFCHEDRRAEVDVHLGEQRDGADEKEEGAHGVANRDLKISMMICVFSLETGSSSGGV